MPQPCMANAMANALVNAMAKATVYLLIIALFEFNIWRLFLFVCYVKPVECYSYAIRYEYR
jgi:hypothetical protein